MTLSVYVGLIVLEHTIRNASEIGTAGLCNRMALVNGLDIYCKCCPLRLLIVDEGLASYTHCTNRKIGVK